MYAGRGAIFMLHHIFPGGGLERGFAPNAGLEISPEFLDCTISRVRELGYRLLSLEQAVEELLGSERTRPPFAVFTIDDGYRDNLDFALPQFRKHDCPFTIFVAPAIIDGTCELWWRGLESIVASAETIAADINGERFVLAARTLSQKRSAYERLYWPLRRLPEHEQRQWIRQFCGRHGFDLHDQCRKYAMTWNEVREIARDPLCSIGAHTVNHLALAKLEANEAALEASASRQRLESELGMPIKVFAYPYGDELSASQRDFEIIRNLGFVAAVTTWKGLIYDEHRNALTALPRVSLNGGYQKLRYLDTLLTGAPFVLWNAIRPETVT
jgi:peptidoglycan/xylan/chitin deacetylase (PgdA/CDA1 family)